MVRHFCGHVHRLHVGICMGHLQVLHTHMLPDTYVDEFVDMYIDTYVD